MLLRGVVRGKGEEEGVWRGGGGEEWV